MGRIANVVAERWSRAARWVAVSTGVIVLLALPIVFVMAVPGSELGGLNIVPAVGILVLELCIWWKPVELSVRTATSVPAVLFCFGAIVSQLPAVTASATNLVVDSYLDIFLILAFKVAAAIGTWALQGAHRIWPG